MSAISSYQPPLEQASPKVVHVVCIAGNPHNPARSPHVIPLGMHDTGLTVEIKEMRGYGTKMANRPMMSQDSVID